MELAGKVCLVTGASGGIGEALGDALTAEGAKVVLFARRKENLQHILARLGEHNAAIAAGDVTNADDLKRAVDLALERFGKLDVLINNAGVAVMARLSSVPVDLFQRGWRTNVLGPVLALQAALPALKTQGGMIVNVSSAMSLHGSATMAVYAASKAALNVLSASMRQELKEFNIQVMTVFPGFIGNDFGLNTLAESEEIAAGRRASSRSRSSRTSADAANDIIAAMKADREFFRSNEEQPLVAPL